jgi:hypothetical protein
MVLAARRPISAAGSRTACGADASVFGAPLALHAVKLRSIDGAMASSAAICINGLSATPACAPCDGGLGLTAWITCCDSRSKRRLLSQKKSAGALSERL